MPSAGYGKARMDARNRGTALTERQKVMLDADLAELYQVSTKVLNQAVKRNKARFPADFMFEPTPEEFAALRSQIVTLESGRGHGVMVLQGRKHSTSK